jgi:selenocysteine-specific elongation factor
VGGASGVSAQGDGLVQHVVATAGHVDHGKSALVRALTGMEPDRYAEERRRGMTIDLGFVWTTLDLSSPAVRQRPVPTSENDVRRAAVAFVDVPGHERFVSTMLAGVGPVPAVLFVVAADEGWMPQSTEHLAALDALGVRHAVVAVTRSDLADPAPVVASVQRRLAPTSLAGGAVVPVSAVTGVGLDLLRIELGRLLLGLPVPERSADVRMWVDRSFTVAGAGTVVTGTLPAGALAVGDELDLHAADGSRRVVVRGLQSLGERRDVVHGVARVAVNLRGVRHDEVRRGDAVVAPATVTPAELVDVRVHRAASPASSREPTSPVLPAQCLVHLGSAQVAGTVRPLGGDIVRLRLSRPLPLRLGDRLLLRDPGRHLVLGSATVLDPAPLALRRRGDARRRAAELGEAPERVDVAGELRRRGTATAAALRALGCSAADVDAVAAVRAPGGWLVDVELAGRLRDRLHEAVGEHARARPLDPGLPIEQARQLLELPDVRIVAMLVGPGLLVRDGRISLAAATQGDLPQRVRQAVDAVRDDLVKDPFVAPDATRLSELGLDRRALAAAVRAGLLDRVGGDVYLLPGWAERAAGLLAAVGEPFTVSQARSVLGTTRRVAVPLLERLDADRVTARMPDDRRVVRDGSGRE